ncbi:MAG TPA: MBL fold metallo-hydrolase [Gemmatimonadales bacterium]|nr:MBL fold metallo-hydrolase [Gemmatimonadales bacterium]
MSSLRRRRLIGLVAASLLVAAGPPPPANEAPPPKPFEIVILAEGVYGFVWKNPLQDPIESNALFIVNEHDVVVVDAGIMPSTARRMAAALRKLTSKPVRYVINTHWHDDHHQGNEVYRDLWPQVEFIAHRDTRTDIFAKTYAPRADVVANMKKENQRYVRWAASGKDDDGKPIDERRRARMREIAEVYAPAIAEIEKVRNTPPDLTLVDRLVLHRGKRTIDIRWLGRGNTRGDVVVFLPEERIVATGDLIVSPIPFGIGSYYRDWIATLGRLDSLPADVLFLGHGGPLRDRTYLHEIRDLLTALVTRVDSAVAAGATVEETRKRVTLADWKLKLAGEDRQRQGGFDAVFVTPAVERAWQQAKGEPDDAPASQ